MAKKNNIKDISRRRFIKKVVFAGAGTTLLPGTMFANGKESTSTPKNSPPLLTSPCLVKPTSSAITVNIVGDDKPIDCFIRFKEAREEVLPWQNTEIFSINKYTPFNISLNSLKAGTDQSIRFMPE